MTTQSRCSFGYELSSARPSTGLVNYVDSGRYASWSFMTPWHKRRPGTVLSVTRPPDVKPQLRGSLGCPWPGSGFGSSSVTLPIKQLQEHAREATDGATG